MFVMRPSSVVFCWIIWKYMNILIMHDMAPRYDWSKWKPNEWNGTMSPQPFWKLSSLFPKSSGISSISHQTVTWICVIRGLKSCVFVHGRCWSHQMRWICLRVKGCYFGIPLWNFRNWSKEAWLTRKARTNVIWLVVWLPCFIFPLILGCDYHPNWLIFFRTGWPWPTNQIPKSMGFHTSRDTHGYPWIAKRVGFRFGGAKFECMGWLETTCMFEDMYMIMEWSFIRL